MDIEFEQTIICDVVAELIFEQNYDLTARWKQVFERITYLLFSFFFFFLFFICFLFVSFFLSQ